MFLSEDESRSVFNDIPVHTSEDGPFTKIACSPDNRPGSAEYKKVMPGLRAIVDKHKAQMVLGKPQLNWCDNAVQVRY